MALRPQPGGKVRLKGRLDFVGVHPAVGTIQDSFELEIDVPKSFPAELPTVTETGGRIPRLPGFHVNRNDGTLCLGSPVRLRLLFSTNPTLTGFAENCIVPYLFGMSHSLRTGAPLPFDELDHGAPGALADYQELLHLESPEQALSALRLLGLKKRMANKRPCPCGCGKRLGRCAFRARLTTLRAIANLPWYRKHYKQMACNRLVAKSPDKSKSTTPTPC